MDAYSANQPPSVWVTIRPDAMQCRPEIAPRLRAFEVDQAGPQTCKRERLIKRFEKISLG